LDFDYFYLNNSVYPSTAIMNIKPFSLYLVAAYMFFIAGLLTSNNSNAQPWMDGISKDSMNFYTIRNTYQKKRTDNNQDTVRDGEYKKFKRWEWFMEPRVYPSGDISLPSTNSKRFQEYLTKNENKQTPTNFNTTSRSVTGNWTSLGPFSASSHPNYGHGGVGRIDFITIDPLDPNIIWVGSPSGGLWKSIDGGVNWNTNTDLLSVLGCSDLVIDPTNSNIIYLATGDKNTGQINSIGILKSTDGGTTWNPSGLSWTVNSYNRIFKLLIKQLMLVHRGF
jgi:hypothetical protein